MRLISLLVTATLVATPSWAAGQAPSSSKDQAVQSSDKAGQDERPSAQASDQPPATSHQYDLPVSLDKIKQGLEQPPALSLKLDEVRPTFRVQILERQKIEELLATLNFKTTRAPAGGLYWDEVRRQMWPATDNPLQQPYAAFNQGELLTILIENLVGKLVASKAGNAIAGAARSRAESEARDEVRQAIRDYCAAQPNNGAGIQICTTSTAGVR
jgi:ribosomal protein L12E/L44/L45/RPP1/RPP2